MVTRNFVVKGVTHKGFKILNLGFGHKSSHPAKVASSSKSQIQTLTTCLADKTNHPVERLSLNRSQCGSCSTKYDTSAGT